MEATLRELLPRLDAERVLRLDANTWAEVERAFAVRARHATGIAGDLVIASAPGDGESGLVGIESPETGDDVYVRRFADEAEANAWVIRRLDAYERMWDG